MRVPCEGILGGDLLESAVAKICYATRTLTLGTSSDKVNKALLPLSTEGLTRAIRRLVLPSRTELVVRLPVNGEPCNREGITAKREIQAGVYLAGAMTGVQAGYAITRVTNTNSEDIKIDEPELEVTAIETGPDEQSPERDGNGRNLNRAEEVLKRLRLEHLNDEERKQVEKTCAAY